jgi:hypothetical protein
VIASIRNRRTNGVDLEAVAVRGGMWRFETRAMRDLSDWAVGSRSVMRPATGPETFAAGGMRLE